MNNDITKYQIIEQIRDVIGQGMLPFIVDELRQADADSKVDAFVRIKEITPLIPAIVMRNFRTNTVAAVEKQTQTIGKESHIVS